MFTSPATSVIYIVQIRTTGVLPNGSALYELNILVWTIGTGCLRLMTLLTGLYRNPHLFSVFFVGFHDDSFSWIQLFFVVY